MEEVPGVTETMEIGGKVLGRSSVRTVEPSPPRPTPPLLRSPLLDPQGQGQTADAPVAYAEGQSFPIPEAEPFPLTLCGGSSGWERLLRVLAVFHPRKLSKDTVKSYVKKKRKQTNKPAEQPSSNMSCFCKSSCSFEIQRQLLINKIYLL